MEKIIERYNITHIYVSKSLKSNNFFNNFNLIDYKNENKNENTLFFGVYGLNDFKKINNHIGKKIIFWGGNDANTNNFKRLKLMKIIKNATHIADTEIIYKNLIKVYDDDKIEITYKSNHNKSIINYKSINYLKNIVDKSEKIIILSKGNNYDFSQDEPEDTHLYVGIKQSIMNLPRKDILIMNDFNSIFGIENVISEIKIILCPDLIHLYEKPNKEANHFLEDYLKLHNFNGVIINYQIPSNNNINNELFRYSKPIFDTGEIIFAILEHIGTENKFINIYGLYESFNDNFKITTSIKNAIVPLNYKIFYDDYIKIIHNKINKNKNNMRIQSENQLIEKKMYIYNRNLKLFNKNFINWNKKIYIFLLKNSGYEKMLGHIFNNFKLEIDVEIVLYTTKTTLDEYINFNCIYLFIKHFDQLATLRNFMNKISKYNNNLIFQTLDYEWNSDFEKYKNIDIFKKLDLICNNKATLDLFNFKSEFLYHCYDLKNYNKLNNNKLNNINVIYNGIIEKTAFSLNMFKEYNILYSDYDLNDKNQIYIDYCLQNNINYLIHTSTKLANCLALDSIFICNKIPIYIELLGDNYDFYFNDDLSNLNEIIEKAKNIFIHNKYYEYRNKYKYLRIKLSPENMKNNYKMILNNYMYSNYKNNLINQIQIKKNQYYKNIIPIENINLDIKKINENLFLQNDYIFLRNKFKLNQIKTKKNVLIFSIHTIDNFYLHTLDSIYMYFDKIYLVSSINIKLSNKYNNLEVIYCKNIGLNFYKEYSALKKIDPQDYDNIKIFMINDSFISSEWEYIIEETLNNNEEYIGLSFAKKVKKLHIQSFYIVLNSKSIIFEYLNFYNKYNFSNKSKEMLINDIEIDLSNKILQNKKYSYYVIYPTNIFLFYREVNPSTHNLFNENFNNFSIIKRNRFNQVINKNYNSELFSIFINLKDYNLIINDFNKYL